MTWSYDSSNLTESSVSGKKNIIRLIIGDIDTTDQQMQDEEINYFLTANNNALYATTKQCVLALIAKYSRDVDEWLGHTRLQRSQRVRNYKNLLSQLESDFSRLTAIALAGGLSISEKITNTQDSDATQPAFRRNMYTEDDLGD